jgi:2,4-dienoyl-CoA reductase (NADPH2)
LTGEGAAPVRDKLTLVQRGIVGAAGLMGISARPRLARELTRAWMPVGKRVVIIGGGLVGVELAEFLCERGRRVSVLEEGPVCGAELAPPRRWRVLHTLREHGVQLLTRVRVEAIGEVAVEYRDEQGAHNRVARDSVIIATGTRDNRALGEELAKLGTEVHLLGDCNGVGYIAGAMMDAARTARKI